MKDSIATIDRLLREVAAHLNEGTKKDRTAAALKLHRIASIASTLAFTINAAR